MPYARRLRLTSPLLSWHEVDLLESSDAWSPEYTAETPRLLLPRSHWLECAVADERFLCDGISPVWLTPEQPYRMRQPWSGQRSIVLVLHQRPAARLRQRPPLSPTMQLRLAGVAAAIAQGSTDALAAEEWLATFLEEPAAGVAGSTSARTQRAVGRVREMLASLPASTASLGELAGAACASPFHLARAFRRVTGMTIHAYRTRLRMAEALARLQNGESDLSALALDLGFSSHSHLTATVRRTFGTTPSDLRTNLAAQVF